MQPIDLNELTRWSRWPARLMGAEAFDQQHRDVAKIEQEYDREKFKRCLDLHRADARLDPVQLRFAIDRERGDGARDGVVDGKMVAADLDTLTDTLFATLDAALARPIAESASVVELGAAFAANLWWLARRYPDRRYVAGDYSDNAIALGRALYADGPAIEMTKLNFYDARYPALDAAEGPVTVFTSQAIEQLPSVAPVLDALARYRDRVAHVIHLEPAYDLHDPNTRLRLMCRRYLEVNDYCRDLVSALEARDEIEILDLKPNVFGFNAFNALSLVHWRFR